jgi:hypothetical protein
MPRVKVKRKCSNCGVPGHNKASCDVVIGRSGAKPPANGQPTLDGYREHGVQWLKDRREILLQQVDQVDAALKLMS